MRSQRWMKAGAPNFLLEPGVPLKEQFLRIHRKSKHRWSINRKFNEPGEYRGRLVLSPLIGLTIHQFPPGRQVWPYEHLEPLNQPIVSRAVA